MYGCRFAYVVCKSLSGQTTITAVLFIATESDLAALQAIDQM